MMIELYLMRHAHAVLAAVDPARPLSPRGREDAGISARILKANGVRLNAVWHSSKRRAMETAAIVAGILNFGGALEKTEGLDPDDLPDRTVMALDQTVIENPGAKILIVSHLPFLPHLVTKLGNFKQEIPFSEAALLCLTRTENGPWQYQWNFDPDGQKHAGKK
jgi:phosphohistidine phosphatase